MSQATSKQTPPTGDGAIVLEYVQHRIDNLVAAYTLPQAERPLMEPKNLFLLAADLRERAEVGAKKYGTPLRVHNGRSAILDLYQELSDAVMYSAQARMEGDTVAGNYLELLINLASQVAGELRKR